MHEGVNMDNILEPKPLKEFHSINERCEDLRNALVEHIVKYLKNIAEWSDEQITTIDVDVYEENKSIISTVKVDADMDTKYILCDLLTGVLYTKGYMQSQFEVYFPDELIAKAKI